jgi:nucleotide-binding universal stress UspA family protein
VVVGVDPGWRLDGVVRAAAREAERRGTELAIVAVARHSVDTTRSPTGLVADDGWSQATAQRALTDARTALGDLTHRVPCTTYCLWKNELDPNTHPNTHPLSTAQLLVVGSRGRGGRVAFSLNSVSRALLKAVHCPVLTIPGPGTGPGPAVTSHSTDQTPGAVVTGIGDHPRDAAVLRTAAEEAARRGTDLHLIHAYLTQTGETLTTGLRRALTHATHAINATEGLHPAPGTTISLMLTQDTPATALLQQARTATLVVIGSRPGALSGLLLDSVSRALLESSPCPVLVVQRGTPVESGTAATGTAAGIDVAHAEDAARSR